MGFSGLQLPGSLTPFEMILGFLGCHSEPCEESFSSALADSKRNYSRRSNAGRIDTAFCAQTYWIANTGVNIDRFIALLALGAAPSFHPAESDLSWAF